MSDARERGIKVISEMMNPEFANEMASGAGSDEFCGDAGSMALEHAFGMVWSRPGLERKQRSMVTIGVLVALGQILELKNHIRIALNNGCSVVELQEILIQTIPYAGYPAFASAVTAAVEVLREMGLDTKTRTSEEKGLL